MDIFVCTHVRANRDRCWGCWGLHLSRMIEWRRVLRGVRNYVVACLRSCRQGATDGVKSRGVVIACIPVPVSVFPGLLEGARDAFAHHALSLLGTLAPLLALALAGLTLIPVWRVWSRHRLAGAGCWFELRLGEQVSRPALEAFTRTLAGGLPRPLLSARPWVALSVSSQEDRATCGLFISGGLSPAQVRASVEQALGSVTVQPEDGDAGRCWWWECAVEGCESRADRLAVSSVACRSPGGPGWSATRVSASAGSQRGRRRAVGVAGPARSASAKARSQAARLRSGRGLQPERLAARAPDGRLDVGRGT